MGKTYSNVNGTGISTYHLSETPELYEPSRSNAFEFVLDLTNQNAAFSNNKVQGADTADALLAAGTSAATASDDSEDYLTGVSDVIRLSVSEAFVPHFDLGVIEIKRGNSTMKFAGTPTFNDGTLKCNDYVGAKTKDYPLAQRLRLFFVIAEFRLPAPIMRIPCHRTLRPRAPIFKSPPAWKNSCANSSKSWA